MNTLAFKIACMLLLSSSAAMNNDEFRFRMRNCGLAGWNKTHSACVDMPNWDVSGINDMSWMLAVPGVPGDSDFNIDISSWNTSAVTTLEAAFYLARDFNADISRWDTSRVTNMRNMFGQAQSFNADISRWNTSGVTNMDLSFFGASSFNADISGWDIQKVQSAHLMFAEATSFNVDLCTWKDSEDIVSGLTFRNSPKQSVCDVNECLDTRCEWNAVCINTDGSFTCECSDGLFSLSGDGNNCEIEQCAEGAHDCHPDATCTGDENGNPTCACNVGFSGDGITCTDVNECMPDPYWPVATHWRVTNLGDCGWRPSVTNLVMVDSNGQELHNYAEIISSGSYSASDSAENAADGDPWTLWRPHIHAPRAREVWIGLRFDTPTEVRKARAKGLGIGSGGGASWNGGVELQYSHDGRHWRAAGAQPESDVAIVTVPAAEDPACGTHSLCTNTPGSFRCECNDGYVSLSGLGIDCQLLGNCDAEENNCHPDATCQIGITDQNPTPVCVCNAGFSGDGITCTDVNECIPGSATFWRVTNLGDCGWRPSVSKLVMWNSNGQELHNYAEIISSGSYSASDSAENAADGDPWTLWRPHIHAPRAREVWIGLRFDTPTEVRKARAKGLGIGSGGGASWNGGVELQYSHDGRHWRAAASTEESDGTIVKRAVIENDCDLHAQCVNSAGSFTCECPQGWGTEDAGVTCTFPQWMTR